VGANPGRQAIPCHSQWCMRALASKRGSVEFDRHGGSPAQPVPSCPGRRYAAQPPARHGVALPNIERT